MSRSLRMRTTPEESVGPARDGHEVDLTRDGERAHEIGHEEDRALEDADEQGPPSSRSRSRSSLPSSMIRDCSVGSSISNFLSHAPRAQFASRPRSPLPLRRCPVLRRPRHRRTTSGHDSRSERGILASTNTSWIFLVRPASRSPARHPRTLRPRSRAEMRHGPQRTSPSSATGVCSSQIAVVLADRR